MTPRHRSRAFVLALLVAAFAPACGGQGGASSPADGGAPDADSGPSTGALSAWTAGVGRKVRKTDEAALAQIRKTVVQAILAKP